MIWEGDRLSAAARASVVAWGAEPFGGVSVQLSQAGRDLGSSRFEVLAQAEPVELELPLPFADLRRAAIGEAPIIAGAGWQGGSREASVFVDAAQLLRLAGGRIELGGRR